MARTSAPHEPLDRSACRTLRRSAEPDVVSLDPSLRAELTRLRGIGGITVRYEGEGCDAELHVLTSCIARTRPYTYSPYAATSRRVAHDASELFGPMPLGAPGLYGWMRDHRALRADLVLSGQYAIAPEAMPRAADLVGQDCARATHVVSAVYVGAFAIAAGPADALETPSSILDLDASSRDLRVLAAEGSADACASARAEGREDRRCATPLRIALVPLDAAPVTAAAAKAGNERTADRCVTNEVAIDPEVAPTPPAALRSESGYLSMDTYPFTRVWLGGKAIGETPLVRVALPPGTHVLTLENPGEKLRVETSVTIRSGETISRRFAF